MGERWPDWVEWPMTLYAHGGDRELSSKQWDDYKEPVVEVVPASALKQCEEERDELRKITDQPLIYGSEAIKARDAEAKCERLEAERAAIYEAAFQIGGGKPKYRGERLSRIREILSTPKTEGER